MRNNSNSILNEQITEPLKLSKTKRPEIQGNLREEFVSQDIGNSVLHRLQYPAVLYFEFKHAHCFELLHGKLFDANYDQFPNPKPPSPWYDYTVQIIGASESETVNEEACFGEGMFFFIVFFIK